MLITTKEVAALLRVHPKHVYRLLKRGLPARRVGDEWRFDETDVMRWSGERAPPTSAPSELGSPPLLAANGDIAIEVLLSELQRAQAPLLGLVLADQGVGLDLLRARAVSAAGSHGDDVPRDGDRLVRMHLMHREVGLVFRRGLRVRRASAVVGRRFASRPSTAGVRVHLDAALRSEGVEPSKSIGIQCASHRDVVIAVGNGEAEIGLASRAWATRMGLGFFALASEPYGLLLRAQDLGSPPFVTLCEIAQSALFRKRLRAADGYDPRRAGELRFNGKTG